MKKWMPLAAALAVLSACTSAGNAIDPDQDAKEAVRQQKDCDNPEWKAAHLGIWYSVCRANAAVH